METATVLCTFADIALGEIFYYTFKTDKRYTNKEFVKIKAKKTRKEGVGLAGECEGIEDGVRYAATAARKVLKIL